jgi:hypothetical protein
MTSAMEPNMLGETPWRIIYQVTLRLICSVETLRSWGEEPVSEWDGLRKSEAYGGYIRYDWKIDVRCERTGERKT